MHMLFLIDQLTVNIQSTLHNDTNSPLNVLESTYFMSRIMPKVHKNHCVNVRMRSGIKTLQQKACLTGLFHLSVNS